MAWGGRYLFFYKCDRLCTRIFIKFAFDYFDIPRKFALD